MAYNELIIPLYWVGFNSDAAAGEGDEHRPHCIVLFGCLKYRNESDEFSQNMNCIACVQWDPRYCRSVVRVQFRAMNAGK